MRARAFIPGLVALWLAGCSGADADRLPDCGAPEVVKTFADIRAPGVSREKYGFNVYFASAADVTPKGSPVKVCQVIVKMDVDTSLWADKDAEAGQYFANLYRNQSKGYVFTLAAADDGQFILTIIE